MNYTSKIIILLLFLVNVTSANDFKKLIGSYSPISKGYWSYGDLVIESDKISWKECKNTPFKIYKIENGNYYLELLTSEYCGFDERGAFMILKLEGREIEASVCEKLEEFQKNPGDRYCSWGVLKRRN